MSLAGTVRGDELQESNGSISQSQTSARPALRSSSSQTSLSEGYSSAASSDGEGVHGAETPEAWLKRRMESKRRRVEEEIEQYRKQKLEELKSYEKRLLKKYKVKKQKANLKGFSGLSEEIKSKLDDSTNKAEGEGKKAILDESSPPYERELHGIFTPSYLPLLEGSYFNNLENDTPARRRSSSISEHTSTSLYSPPDVSVSVISAGIASRRHSLSATGVPLPPSLKPRSSFGQTTPRQKSPKRVTFKLDETMPIPSRSSPSKVEESEMPSLLAAHMQNGHLESSELQVDAEPTKNAEVLESATALNTALNSGTPLMTNGEAVSANTAPLILNVPPLKDSADHSTDTTAPTLIRPLPGSITNGSLAAINTGIDLNAFEDDDEDVFDMDESVPMMDDDGAEPVQPPVDPFADMERLPYRRSSISSPLSSQNTQILAASLPQAFTPGSFTPGSIRRRSISKYLPEDDDVDAEPEPPRSPSATSPTKPDVVYNRANPPNSLPISVSAPPLPQARFESTGPRVTPLPTPSNKLLNPFASPKNSPYFTKVAAEVAKQAEAEGTIGVGSVVGGIDGSTGYDEFPSGSMVFGSRVNDGQMSFSMKLRAEEEKMEKNMRSNRA